MFFAEMGIIQDTLNLLHLIAELFLYSLLIQRFYSVDVFK